MSVKIVFEEGNQIRTLHGEIIDDSDEIFLAVREEKTGKEFKINKGCIVKIIRDDIARRDKK